MDYFWDSFYGQCDASQRPDTEFHMYEYVPFLYIASYSTGFGFLVVHLPCKPHPLQMRLVRLIVHFEEWKVVGSKTQRTSFTLFAAISQFSTCHLCAWEWCMGIRQVMTLISNAKQTMSERKSGLVETKQTRPVATALCLPRQRGGSSCWMKYNVIMGQLCISGRILMWTKIERDITSGLLWGPNFCMDYIWE